jgi:superfamily II DNA or RNA helicase
MIDLTITIEGNRAFLEGEFPLDLVREVTSYFVEGYKYVESYRKGFWNGRKNLYHKPSNSMPAGLVNIVKTALLEKEPEAKIKIKDLRKKFEAPSKNQGFDLKGSTNCGKTSMAVAITKDLGVPTVFLVTSIDLLRQAHSAYCKFLQLDPNEVGEIGDGVFRLGEWITIATVQSLHTRLQEPEVIEAMAKWDLVFIDECHRSASETFFDVLDAIPATRRFGLSGTPLDRSDGADLCLIAQAGDIIYEIGNKLLIERGVSAKPYIRIFPIREPKLDSDLTWQQVNKQGVVYNETLNDKVVEIAKGFADRNLRTVVLVDEIEHGNLLNEKINNSVFVHGEHDSDFRLDTFKKFVNRKIPVLIASKILDEGVDISGIDAMIFASSGKSKIRALQRLGRGMRIEPGKDKFYVIDFANFTHKFLAKHSKERLDIYRSENAFDIKMMD